MTTSAEQIIIHDKNTNAILCQVETPFLARSLTMGMLNGDTAILVGRRGGWGVIADREEKNIKIDFNNIDVHYQLISKDPLVVPLRPDLITPEWIATRLRVLTKLKWLTQLEYLVRSMTSKTTEYYGTFNFEGFLSSQLDKCKPDIGYYTHAIKEWAAIQDIPDATAFQELTIRSEHYGLTYLRNHGIYLKYLRKINQCNTEEEYLQCCNLAWDELMRNALI